ncbi:MAG: DUF4351 domain-containing protein [Caldilineaceae bacterium]
MTKRSGAAPNYDSPWKEVITHFFDSFLAFFFADIYEAVDWTRPPEFLDKELQQISVEAKIRRRLADTLVKVWLRNGTEVWVLIHIEVQGRHDPDFERRMFVYYYRIFDRYDRPIVSLAVLADSVRKWRPAEFQSELFNSGVQFRFRSAKLLDYAKRLDELETNNNPFAVVVIAHLQTQATRRKINERYTAKFQLMRRLYERGYPAERIRQLFRFIDWIMVLPEELAQEFKRELHAYEETRKMPYVTSIERIAIEEGRQKGLQEGLQEGLQQGLQQGAYQTAIQLVLRLLTRLFGEIDADTQAWIRALRLEQLEQLGEALLDFTAPEDLQTWLHKHAPPPVPPTNQ